MIETARVAASVATVRERIADAARRVGRDPDGVRIIGVTKGQDASAITAAVAAGITDIGESRVQETVGKQEIVETGSNTLHWHLIGHLQSNKVARAAQLFDAVHTVDSIRVGEALAEQRDYAAEPLVVLVQVDYTRDPNRSGVSETDALTIVRALAGTGGIHPQGLMTVAPMADVEVVRSVFARLRRLRDEIEQKVGWSFPDLSMGMSDDFEVAIEEGATMVRLGRVLFGER